MKGNILTTAEHMESYNAQSLAEQVTADIAEMHHEIDRLHRDVYHINDRVNAILQTFGIEEPNVIRTRRHIKSHLVQLKKINEQQNQALDIDEYYESLRVHSEVVAQGAITKQHVQDWYDEADISILKGLGLNS